LTAVIAADWLGNAVRSSPAFDATAATTGDGGPAWHDRAGLGLAVLT
jgi:hypothetical protein